MTWVLIFILNSSGNSTKLIEMHDFGSERTCEAAAAEIKTVIKPDYIKCLEK